MIGFIAGGVATYAGVRIAAFACRKLDLSHLGSVCMGWLAGMTFGVVTMILARGAA